MELLIQKNEVEHKCLNSCPDGYKLTNETVYDNQALYCYKCNNNKYIYYKTCYDNCPLHYNADEYSINCYIITKN
jgi:hypothetical protein